jgi:hypothetical protein
MSTELMNIVPDEKRLIRGERAKFVDGRWSDSSDSPLPEKMLVLRRIRAVQCWREQKIADCIAQKDSEPLPDVDELNAKIPESEWEPGLDGKPRGPWQNVWGFYLCNPQDGSVYTFLNGTIGSRIAYRACRPEILRRSCRCRYPPEPSGGNSQGLALGFMD